MKQELLQEIESQLTAIGVKPVRSDKTDLSVDEELLDASFSTGKKKLHYEAMILLDESDKIIKMYEKTTEISAGVSFGMSGESSFQRAFSTGRRARCLNTTLISARFPRRSRPRRRRRAGSLKPSSSKRTRCAKRADCTVTARQVVL